MTFSFSGARRRSVLRLRSALLLFTAAAAFAPPAAAQDASHEEGIMELVADRLPPSTVIVLVDSAGSVLLPLRQVLEFLGLAQPSAGGDIVVPRVGGTYARIDTAAHRFTLPTRTVQLAPAEMPRRDDVVFMRTEHLATLLEAELHVDFATLSVVFTRAIPFPAQQRVVAEQRRAAVLARQRWLEQHMVRSNIPYEPLSGGLVADWDLNTNSLDPARLTTFRGRAGVAVLGGDLAGGGVLEMGRDIPDDVRDLTLQYHRVFPQSRTITQLRFGDMITTGLFSRHVRGLEVSNRPFLRSLELSSILLHPDLPPGWEFEVFQGNQLVGYSVIGSADAVAVPLRAGATPLQVRMYGPAGEEVVRTLLYQTPISLLHRGAMEYAAGGGRCNVACDQFAHADVRYGINTLVTAGAGLETFRDSTGTTLRPYLIYSMSTGTRATAELTLMPAALYSANLAFYPRAGTAAYLRANVSQPSFAPLTLTRSAARRWDTELNLDQRVLAAPFSQIRFSLSASGAQGAVQRGRVSATGTFGRGYIEMRYDRDDVSPTRDLVTTRIAAFTPFAVRGRTLRPLISSALGVSQGIGLAELAASLQPTSTGLLTAAVQWLRSADRPSFTVGYSVRTGPALASLRAVSSDAGATSFASLSGSLAVSPRGDLTLHPSSRTGYAGLSGIVFLDVDGDGTWSAGDQAVPDAFLVIGGYRVAVDADGYFRAWGLQPYQPVSLAIDSTRTADPGLTTAAEEILVRPAPNMARFVHVPLVRTREVLGSVLADPDAVPTASLSIELTHAESGHVISTTTFSDGFFYLSRVRPGRYRVAVAAASLDAIGATAASPPLDLVIPPGGDDVAVELAPLRIRRR